MLKKLINNLLFEIGHVLFKVVKYKGNPKVQSINFQFEEKMKTIQNKKEEFKKPQLLNFKTKIKYPH